MVKKSRLLIYTFLSVLLSIFIIGYIGISISLSFIERAYIDIQLDVNRRQAESMARILESELAGGRDTTEVLKNLQAAIEGSQTDKGFLCMLDIKSRALVCHPDKSFLGMVPPDVMVFHSYTSDSQQLKFSEQIASGKAVGGLLKTVGTNHSEITYMIPVKGSNWILSSHENTAKIQAEIERQRRIFLIGSVLFGLLMAIVASLVARGISRRYEKKIEAQNLQLDTNLKDLQLLHAAVNEQKDEIEAQRDSLQHQRDTITEQNQNITASIHYASRIQSALLPPLNDLQTLLPDSFVFYKPRDIVSGDFYWIAQTRPNQYYPDGRIIIAAGDCTGHGVPGAFMSVLGITLLHEIVNKNIETDNAPCKANEILNLLRQKVIIALRQTGKADEAKDGMDLSLCVIDYKQRILQFAGANNSLYLVRQNREQNKYELTELKADKMPIGYYFGTEKYFTNQTIELQTGDALYFSSDGYIDQFGGNQNRKYLSKNFKQYLLSIQDNPMNEQRTLLEENFNKWKGSLEQIDDVMVIGIKI